LKQGFLQKDSLQAKQHNIKTRGFLRKDSLQVTPVTFGRPRTSDGRPFGVHFKRPGDG